MSLKKIDLYYCGVQTETVQAWYEEYPGSYRYLHLIKMYSMLSPVSVGTAKHMDTQILSNPHLKEYLLY